MLILLALALLADDPPKPKAFVPTSAYTTQSVQGWTVHINKQLRADKKELGDRALKLLDEKLAEIVATIPEPALARLREIPIWLGVDDGHAPCAEYHPNQAWLRLHGYNPDKAKCVEIGNAARFLEWSADQPSMVFHELAHGYHDRVLSFSYKPIADAYKRAKQSTAYDQVRHVRGGLERHYALTDPQEFFAELSESYFGKNDFYPFTYNDLQVFDPATATLIHLAWTNPANSR